MRLRCEGSNIGWSTCIHHHRLTALKKNFLPSSMGKSENSTRNANIMAKYTVHLANHQRTLLLLLRRRNRHSGLGANFAASGSGSNDDPSGDGRTEAEATLFPRCACAPRLENLTIKRRLLFLPFVLLVLLLPLYLQRNTAAAATIIIIIIIIALTLDNITVARSVALLLNACRSRTRTEGGRRRADTDAHTNAGARAPPQRESHGLPNVGVYQSTGLLIHRFLILTTRVNARTLTLVV